MLVHACMLHVYTVLLGCQKRVLDPGAGFISGFELHEIIKCSHENLFIYSCNEDLWNSDVNLLHLMKWMVFGFLVIVPVFIAHEHNLAI